MHPFVVLLVVHVADPLQDGKEEPFLVFVGHRSEFGAALGSETDVHPFVKVNQDADAFGHQALDLRV